MRKVIEAQPEVFRRASRPLYSYFTPDLLPLYSYPSKRVFRVILLPLILSFFALGCAPRTGIKPPPEPWDVVLTNEGEKIECRILDLGFPDIKIQPKYGPFSYTIPRTDIQQITFHDGRELFFLKGVGMPAESLAKREAQEREIEKDAGTYNRQLYRSVGVMGGGLASTGILWAVASATTPFIILFPPFDVLLIAPMIIGGTAGYNYGKKLNLQESRKKQFGKSKPDSLTIRLQRLIQK